MSELISSRVLSDDDEASNRRYITKLFDQEVSHHNLGKIIDNKFNGDKDVQITYEELLYFYQYKIVEQGADRIYGPLNISALRKSFQTLVERHDVLRTVYSVNNDKVLRLTIEADWFSIKEIDLRNENEENHKSEIMRQAEVDVADITGLQKPLIRASLLHLDHHQYVLIITLHHIIVDRIANSILLTELGELYSAYADNKPCPLTSLSIQYNDYLQDQQAWHGSEKYDAMMRYWTKRLEGIPPIMALPTDRSVTDKDGNCQLAIPIEIPHQLLDDVLARVRSEGITFFVFMATTISLLIYDLSKQSDIFIKYSRTSRTHPKYRDVVGNFNDTSLFRIDVDNQLTLKALFCNAKENAFKDAAYNRIPFFLTKKIVNDHMGGVHHNIRQVGLNVFPKFETSNFMGVNTEQVPSDELTQFPNDKVPGPVDGFGLEFKIAPYDGGDSKLEYNNVMYDKETMKKMLARFYDLLKLTTYQAELPISVLLSKLPEND